MVNFNTPIYISGKITEKDPKKQALNERRFDRAEKKLKEIGFKEVINPALLKRPDFEYHDYLGSDFAMIVEKMFEQCTKFGVPLESSVAFYMLSNWKESLGAQIENVFARKMGLPITYE